MFVLKSITALLVIGFYAASSVRAVTGIPWNGGKPDLTYHYQEFGVLAGKGNVKINIEEFAVYLCMGLGTLLILICCICCCKHCWCHRDSLSTTIIYQQIEMMPPRHQSFNEEPVQGTHLVKFAPRPGMDELSRNRQEQQRQCAPPPYSL